MLKLEDIQKGHQIGGLLPNKTVRIIQVEAISQQAITVYYKDDQGQLGEQILFRSDESRLYLVQNRLWRFDASGDDFKLALEAWRIRLAHLFDPMMALHAADIEPLPHQIAAVYETMLPRQPLRFVLADDPGAGKTIMAGLLISELRLRAAAQRILIIAPGALVEQWQTEMMTKFNLPFVIFNREKQASCASGNYFNEQDLIIARLDQLARSPNEQQKLKVSHWDLIIVDEAHKLSASYFGHQIHKTKRFQLGELLSRISYHFLLITATPHNGKEEDFQIWLSLLDKDRFQFRRGKQRGDISDLMRRMLKEELIDFDGRPLFPERRAYTVNYQLSPAESELYHAITAYVRHQMNRADRLSKKKKNNIGFALTQLQRRLASSPKAIYQSLKRRRQRLQAQLNAGQPMRYMILEADNLEDELTPKEYEQYADQMIAEASTAASRTELELEIEQLQSLEKQALQLLQSAEDKKWEELSRILKEIMDNPRPLIIFTEYRDTLDYLQNRIQKQLAETVLVIHGGLSLDQRRQAESAFRQQAKVLLATDAAGEGINLQNAHLMINYDLPWNPNRLEQRFGRIHRIGQKKVCHLWNLVAQNTREAQVFQTLFAKLETERQALGGKVFDILGEAFKAVSLKDLLIEAIRYGESPEVKARLKQKIQSVLDTERLKAIMDRNALVSQHISLDELYTLKENMDKAEARKIQPYFIQSFFKQAWSSLGGRLRTDQASCYQIEYIPAAIRAWNHSQALPKRICFNRTDQNLEREWIHFQHPLMQAVLDQVLTRYADQLQRGAILLDPHDQGTEAYVLMMVDHAIRDGQSAKIISRRLHFIKMNAQAQASLAGWAPHLDLQAIDKHRWMDDLCHLFDQDLEKLALKYVSQSLVPEHYQTVQSYRQQQADKILAAVQERLVKEINACADHYIELSEAVKAGLQPQMPLEMMRRRIDELTERLQQRQQSLTAMKHIITSPPTIISAALVIPQGLWNQHQHQMPIDIQSRFRIEKIAMQAVMAVERRFGHEVWDVSAEKCGWDITARPPPNPDGSIKPDRHIEVKGRAKGQRTITVSRNEILYGLNQKEQFILAIVIVDKDQIQGIHYIRQPFEQVPDWAETSKNLDLNKLLSKAIRPEQSL